jgi:SAM-dependent MidA family methyltransferase
MDEPESLERRIVERIRRDGPMTFAAYMDAALYDESSGYYARLPIGESEDFVTSPHVSPVFGELVAAQVHEFWQLLGEPAPFEIIEAGAGDGTLAVQILGAIVPAMADSVSYTAVDRSHAARHALRRNGIRIAATLGEVAPVEAGCVVANELLDNVAAHWVRRTSDGLLRERCVGLDANGSLSFVDQDLSTPELEPLAGSLRPGAEALVRPAALEVIEEIARMLGRGYAWIVDYGFTGGAMAERPHGYRAHRLEEDVLAAPGSKDITAGVDFDALAGHARQLGLAVWGPVTQRQALRSLGWATIDRDRREAQAAAIGARQGITALRAYSDRGRAAQLIAPGGLGDFLVLGLGVNVDPTRVPQSMRGDLS